MQLQHLPSPPTVWGPAAGGGQPARSTAPVRTCRLEALWRAAECPTRIVER